MLFGLLPVLRGALHYVLLALRVVAAYWFVGVGVMLFLGLCFGVSFSLWVVVCWLCCLVFWWAVWISIFEL